MELFKVEFHANSIVEFCMKALRGSMDIRLIQSKNVSANIGSI